MKLIDALTIANAPFAEDTAEFVVGLAFSGTPTHLETFLRAHLRRLRPTFRVRIEHGAFDDCLGNLRGLAVDGLNVGFAILEWPDFDPRLGIRRLGGWSPNAVRDMVESVRARGSAIARLLEIASRKTPVVVSLPTLPLVPFSHFPSFRSSAAELEIRAAVSAVAVELAHHPRISVVSSQALDGTSPLPARFDIRAELTSGFPYCLGHASMLAEAVARSAFPAAPKKGLITDLDDTLWQGLVGEVGAAGVSWDLDHKAQLHGLYQQLVASLADTGTLVAVASKNDLGTASLAFDREDIHLSKSQVFPFEAHWGPKSQSVGRILSAWNVAADSVVFVDDSAIELAEVAAAHPTIECIQFPRKSEAGVYELLWRLRDIFGKPGISSEDVIRLDSIRRTQDLKNDAGSDGSSDSFLEQLDAELSPVFQKAPLDPRAFELINKTNQFNLNGRRWLEKEWEQYLERDDTFTLVVDYTDKYGPLGKVSVVAGRISTDRLSIDAWVLSCRAFSRRIEHQCLCVLYDRFGKRPITFNFVQTERNSPVSQFLTSILDATPSADATLSADVYSRTCPPLFHRLKEQ